MILFHLFSLPMNDNNIKVRERMTGKMHSTQGVRYMGSQPRCRCIYKNFIQAIRTLGQCGRRLSLKLQGSSRCARLTSSCETDIVKDKVVDDALWLTRSSLFQASNASRMGLMNSFSTAVILLWHRTPVYRATVRCYQYLVRTLLTRFVESRLIKAS